MRDHLRTTATIVLAVLLVSTAVVGPVVGQTATSTTTETATATTTDSGGFFDTEINCQGSFWVLLTHPLKETCSFGPGVADKLNATDARETKTSLYTSLSSVERQSQIANDSMANALTGTKTIARMEAKNAYIRALQNGSTKAQALTAANQAIEDYYAVREAQLLNRWTVQVEELKAARSHAIAESGVNSERFINYTWVSSDDSSRVDTSPYPPGVQVNGFSTSSVTLANGSTIDVTQIDMQADIPDGSSTSYSSIVHHIGPTDPEPGIYSWTYEGSPMKAWISGIKIAEPYDGYSAGSFSYVNWRSGQYYQQWQQLQSQQSTVKSNLESYVDSTYSAWEAGLINESEMVDPYLGAREYGPDTGYQSWALRSMTSMGLAPPADLSQMGTMTIRDETTGATYEGILMSDGLPQDDSFEVGTTYDAQTLSGLQFVATREGSHELTGEFIVMNATNSSGSVQSSVSYNTVRYRTTSLTEYKQEMDTLQTKIAEINARQDRLRGSIGGGGLFGGSVSIPMALGIVAVLAAVVLLGNE